MEEKLPPRQISQHFSSDAQSSSEINFQAYQKALLTHPRAVHDPMAGVFIAAGSAPAKGAPFEFKVTIVGARHVRLTAQSCSACTMEYVPGLSHVGEFILLHYTANGTATITSRGKTTQLGPKSLFIRDPSEPSTCVYSNNYKCMTLLLRSVLFYARTGYRVDHLWNCVFTADTLLRRLLRNVCLVVHESLTQLDARDGELICDGILAFFSPVIGEFFRLNPNSYGNSHDQLRTRIIQLMLKHRARHNLTVGTLAQEIGISPRHMTDLFSEIGTSPKAYLMNLRLEHSAFDLREGATAKMPVGEIASSNGFVSAAHFSRLFKVRFGMTPMQWRLRPTTPNQSIYVPKQAIVDS